MQTATGRKLICYGKGTGRELKIYYTEIENDQSAGTERSN